MRTLPLESSDILNTTSMPQPLTCTCGTGHTNYLVEYPITILPSPLLPEVYEKPDRRRGRSS